MVRLKSCFQKGSLFLRKHRKWLHSPFKSKWHQIFSQQLAMINLKKQPPNPSPNPNNLLSSLIDSFDLYNCQPTPQAYDFIIKTLIKTSQLHQIPIILDHFEKVENFETPQFILAYLIMFYGKLNDLQSAVDLFYRLPKFRCVPSVYLLNTLLIVLCRTSKGLKFVPEVILKSRDMNIRLEESTFRLLIDALCRIEKVGYAVEMFKCMIDDGLSVDSKICFLLLSSFCKQKNASSVEVLGFLGELRKLGFCPGIVDYRKVISFLVREGAGMEALNVLNQMKLDGIKPDIRCYNMVLNGVVANGGYLKADELFDELLVFGLIPDVYTCNVYIYGLCKRSNVEAGIEMVASMEKLGCKPNMNMYNILLEALCKNGEINRARELVKEMGSKGFGLRVQTYKAMIHGLISNGKIIEACVLLEEALDKGLCPRSSTFDEVIYGLCHVGSMCKAMQLLVTMVNSNLSPSSRAWEALLVGSESNINLVEDLFIELVGKNLK
ncbi:pentatricopeptide repeat-containing protein At2g38420, mitochondrial [Mercurialis annua]|uniref:pentatricopeptide repeat-containing protein At2g38420, mitochondrial n=1 Tax=Mercurialis annua TaxID=3986 RepID=UPI00215FA793|nr:pentatricopeptide repeat-containing protein At2g38420, mitochondrial [Mercurialis annua]XP_055961720.1 pentatricopeptide repeat-containing protein At2g38420, mitochondrial [Mercurialis annua]XP_055961721.1 pentatricopeptide repeat-containing protein At2g38420, mitochondrial [Mercurialis annua]XP_055961725.1 pentatricopeptide repeat-containing protein At2g38420, mitochondrial [Mercurialis annua]